MKRALRTVRITAWVGFGLALVGLVGLAVWAEETPSEPASMPSEAAPQAPLPASDSATTSENPTPTLPLEGEGDASSLAPGETEGGIAPPTELSLASERDKFQVRFLEPEEGGISKKGHLNVKIEAPLQAVVHLWVNGQEIPSSQIGETLQDAERQIAQYTFISVALEVGPNQLEARITSEDLGEARATRTVYVLGPPHTLAATLAPPELPADGESEALLEVTVTDQWAHAVADGTFVTVELPEGTTSATEDADPSTAGVQTRTVDGKAHLRLRAAKQVGMALLRVRVATLTQTLKLSFTRPLRQWVLVGLGSLKLSALSGTGQLQALSEEDGFEDGLVSDGRAAFYAKGKIRGDYLLTLSYDSKDKVDRLFRDIDPDRFYPIYGDTSSIFFDAQSRSDLYVALEKDNDYYLYGDFNTAFQGTELAAYNRTLNGFKGTKQTDRYLVTVIGALTNQTLVRDEIQGQGISGYYFLSASPIRVGSERVYLEVRDRLQPGIVVDSRQQYRFTDYDIDYDQGTLFFKQPVPAYDAQQNSVIIVVLYEAVRGQDKDWTLGLRGEVTLHPEVRLGGTYANEANGDYTLQGLDVQVQLGAQTRLKAEVTQTKDQRTGASDSGSAWQFGLESRPRSDLDLQVVYRNIGTGYQNPSSSTTSVFGTQFGSRQLDLRARWQADPQTQVRLSHNRSESELGTGGSLSATTLNATRQRGPLQTELELEQRHRDDLDSTTLGLAGRYRLDERLSLYAEREQHLAGEDDTLRPAGTSLGVDYQITPKVGVYLRRKFTDHDDVQTDQTIVGVKSDVAPNTSAFTEYSIGGGIGGNRNLASLGLRNRLQLTTDLRADLSYEKVSSPSGQKVALGAFEAYGVSFEYLPDEPYRSSLKVERRHSSQGAQTNWFFGADGRINSNLSLITKYSRYGDTLRGISCSTCGGTGSALLRTRFLVGLAYRPVANDRLNLFAKYETRQERNDLVNLPTRSRITLGQTEAHWQPDPDWEVVGKYAFRQVRDEAEGFATSTRHDLWLGRVTHRFRPNWDAFVEYRLLRNRDTGDRHQGYALEVGHYLLRDFKVAVGYNFASFDDRDFAGNHLKSVGPYVRFRLKFDEDLLASL